MADNADESGKQAEAEPRAGQRLANARRANGISMRDIAKELHLDEVKVQALEDNRFDVLGAAVFTKGYLRKYAELVHVPIDDVLADYYKMNRATGAPPVVGPKRPKSRAPINPGPWIAGILLLAAVAAGTWWWLNQDSGFVIPARNTGGVPTPAQATAEPAAGSPARAGTGSATPADSGADSGTGTEPSTAPAAAGTGTNALSPPTGAGETNPAPAAAAPQTTVQEPSPPGTAEPGAATRLSLSFSGDCWTEVTDGNGTRLFFGLGTAGRNVSVSGVPPIRVLLGDNDNVRVQVNGRDYVVAPSELRGNTARLSIGGP